MVAPDAIACIIPMHAACICGSDAMRNNGPRPNMLAHMLLEDGGSLSNVSFTDICRLSHGVE